MKSIKTKILVGMILTVVISLVLVGVSGIVLNYSSTRETLEESMTEMAEIAADRVSQQLQAYSNVAKDTGRIARLSAADKTVQDKQEIINQAVQEYGFQRGNIIGRDGISIFDGKDYSDRDYFQEAMAGRARVSEPLVSKITGEFTTIIAAPLWQGGIPGTEVAGAVYFVPKETFLNDIVSDIKVSANGAAYAIDANGYTIADNTMETITTQNIEEEAKSDPSLSGLAAIHKKMRNGERGFGEYQINGVAKYSAFAPIAGTNGWSIGVTAPQSDFMDSTVEGIVISSAILVVSIIVAVIIAIRLALGIGRPVKACAERIQKLAAGDLASPVPTVRSKDEVGILARATHEIASNMTGIVGDISWGLGEMGKGNFKVDSRVKELYVGDFEPMAQAMYQIISQMSSTLSRINQAANEVAAGSGQVSDGAQALSQGATEQASAVQELAATIAEISEQIQQNAESARAASGKAASVGDEMQESDRQMKTMIDAMEKISEKSGEIGKIIKTIEDIAFQTNILALNAAVEAARAGAAGKGFAVVADEVRSLANKSQEAAKETTDLIRQSVEAVEEGTHIVDATAESLRTAVGDAREVVVAIDRISSASEKQAISISQVTQGVDQISGVVQTNSATAEESAAASEELSGQAQMLKQMISRFKFAGSDDSVVTPAADVNAAPVYESSKY